MLTEGQTLGVAVTATETQDSTMLEKHIHSLLEEAGGLENILARLGRLTNKLEGPQMQEAADQETPLPAGILDGCGAAKDRIQTARLSITSHLETLERTI